MATDAELIAAGIHLPENDDYMNLGDDAISANARVLWEKIEDTPQYRGNLDEQTGTLATLEDGTYRVRYLDTAAAWGLPHRLIGILRVTTADAQKNIRFEPNDAAAGYGLKSIYEIATDSNGTLRDRWQRFDKSIMRTAPVVLTAPAGEYGPVAVSREAVRLPFTVPTNVSRVRVHMRPWNYRTEIEWGPARLEGVMIAQAESEGSGTITGSRWYAPNAAGATVPGTGWTSEWFYVGLTPNATFLLSYGAEWLDASRDLVMGTCWTHSDRAEYDSTAQAVYENGWGGFFLQPMDVWIECEAPSSVPIWGYFGASNTMGMDSGDPVYGAYPNVHARKNGAFAALTAAGGWSIMDDSAHNLDTMRRFGYPARILDRAYLDWGSNIAIRGATGQEAIAELERWMNRQLPGFGTPDVHLLTQIAGPGAEDTTDTVGTLSDWNEWIRYTATLRPEVKALHDVAAMFADPARPWTARPELRASAGNVHFNRAGQALRAIALDGEVQLPASTARNRYDLTDPSWQADIPLTADWRTDVSSDVTAYRTGNVVTVAAWRLVAVEGVTGEVLAFTLPIGYRPAGLTQQYTRDSRGKDVSLSYNGLARVTNPATIVAHFSLTFVTTDPVPSD